MDQLGYWTKVLLYPVVGLFDPGNFFAVYYLLAGFLFAAGAYAVSRRGGKLVSPRRLFRFLFPRRVWAHPSSRLDRRLYLLNTILLIAAYSFMVIGANFWRDLTIGGLTMLGGPPPATSEASFGVLALTTVVMLLALDFGYWLAHCMMHKSPVLWEFHKVHHSAEVMTPLTEWRQHPVEMVLFPNVYGLTNGVAFGTMVWLFGAGAQPFELWNLNIFMILYLMTVHHLRHSHIWMPAGGLLGHLLHSPGHHHVHHSAKEQHYDKNMGYFLSIWDWMFGTLVLPGNERIKEIGIGPEGAEHNSVWATVWLPFVKAGRVLMGRKQAA